jgi:type I restriction enzyme, S subunit
VNVYPTARVGEVSSQIRGVSYAKEEANDQPFTGGLPILRANNITESGLNFRDLVYVPTRRIGTEQMLQCGDVVIAASSGSLDVVGKAASLRQNFKGSFGAFCKVLRPDATVDQSYFAHFFRTPEYRRTISGLAAGANINNLRSGDLDDLEIPLPPLEEQRRIAAILDKADLLRSKRTRAITWIDHLQRSIFHTFLNDSSQRKDPIVQLGSAVDHVTVGHVGPSSAYQDENGIPFVRTGNIGRGEVIWDDMLRISPVLHARLKKSQLKRGDILFSRHISNEIRCAIVPESLDGANCANIIIIRPGARVLPEYLLNLIADGESQRGLLRRQVGTAQTVVNTKVVQNWRVPLPPLDAQRALEVSIQELNGTRMSQRLSLKQINMLFSCLQARAFEGKL